MKLKDVLSIVAFIALTIVIAEYVSPLLTIPGVALAMNPINLNVSQMYRIGSAEALRLGQPLELQDQPFYSLITLPAAINPAAGNQFFATIEATVGSQRTNMVRPNQVPPGTNYEIHGVRIFFLAPLTVVFADFATAIRDGFFLLRVNNSDRLKLHLREFLPATVYAPSFSAAAGDNPIVTDVGYDGIKALVLPIPLQGATTFTVTVTFITDVATLGNTVMGIELLGLIDRGNVKLDQSPVRSAASLGA